MTTDEATQAVLALFADEMSMAHTLAVGWLNGGGTENAFDAAKYVEGAARELLEDCSKTAAALTEAAGCEPGSDPYDVLVRVDWMVLGEHFFTRWVEGLI